MRAPQTIEEELNLGDQVGLAFRRSNAKALNEDNILFKKMDAHHYIEKLRNDASKEIYNFFEQIDPKTAPKNLKLLYFYFVGSRMLITEMIEDSVQTYMRD